MKRLRSRRVIFFLLICLVVLGFWRYFKPVPPAVAQAGQPLLPQHLQSVSLPWPSYGYAAIGAQDYGVLDSNPQAKPVPMASTAKVMTALAVLDKKPLKVGVPGPKITITDEDVAALKQAQAGGQSVLTVTPGEQLTEYQALQALLIPSANNVAAILANWAFGSVDNYISYANQKAESLGLKDTTFADASGFSPSTVSSAKDLAALGLVALNNPLISSIVSQAHADLPVAGTVDNVNALLGNDGVIGIKTGNTDQAGGCMLLAAKRMVGKESALVDVAVMSAPDLGTAMNDSRAILLASDQGFYEDTETASATYTTAWGAQAQVAKKTVSTLIWGGQPATVTIKLNKLPAGSPKGNLAGTITVKNAGLTKTENLYLAQPIKKPSFWWRIFRI